MHWLCFPIFESMSYTAACFDCQKNSSRFSIKLFPLLSPVLVIRNQLWCAVTVDFHLNYWWNSLAHRRRPPRVGVGNDCRARACGGGSCIYRKKMRLVLDFWVLSCPNSLQEGTWLCWLVVPCSIGSAFLWPLEVARSLGCHPLSVLPMSKPHGEPGEFTSSGSSQQGFI